MVSQTFRFSGYLEPEEVRAIIGAIPGVSQHPERDILILELLWQSGGRVTEVLTLVPEHIGMTSIILRNLKQAKKVKEGDKYKRVRDDSAIKEVEVSESLCQSIKDYCDKNKIHEGEYIFRPNRGGKGHLYRRYVWLIIGKASESARVYKFGKRDIRTGGRFKGAYPHHFRHSNAMFLLEQVQDITIVQQQLGHADIRTTQGYSYAKRPRIKKEVSKIDWTGKG